MLLITVNIRFKGENGVRKERNKGHTREKRNVLLCFSKSHPLYTETHIVV